MELLERIQVCTNELILLKAGYIKRPDGTYFTEKEQEAIILKKQKELDNLTRNL